MPRDVVLGEGRRAELAKWAEEEGLTIQQLVDRQIKRGVISLELALAEQAKEDALEEIARAAVREGGCKEGQVMPFHRFKLRASSARN